MAPAGAPAIELRGICKAFGPVQANKDISIRVMPGTIHGIIGENGAGKSTLMSILYGFYKADAGEILINGTPTAIPDSQAAIRAGIGMVFQHFKLVQNFTVLENIILGAEDGALLRPSLAKARKTLKHLAEEYELDVDPDALIEELSVGHQQRVEILKALYRQADILILDEPTGVLTPAEADHLFRILANLKAQGKTIILITHKLREIMEATDTVSVMRRGEMTATVKTAETSPEELAELMVGRKVLLHVPKGPSNPGKTVLEIRDLRITDRDRVERVKGVNLTIRAGEILGIAGLVGAAHAQGPAPDPNLARNLAATCANCHGTNGKSLGGMESLAGEPNEKLLQKLADYRSGDKPATIMHQIVVGYTDEQLDLITTWFAAQK